MKWSAGAVPLLALLAAMPVFAAAPIIRSSVQVSPQTEVGRSATLSVEDRLQLLERRMQALTDILMRLDRIQQETQQLRGDVELQGHTLESLKKRQRDLYGDIDRRMMQLTAKPSSPVAPIAPVPSSAPVATPESAAEHTATPLPGTLPSQPVGAADRPPLTSPPGAASQTASQVAPQGVPVEDISSPPAEATASIVNVTPVVGAAPDTAAPAVAAPVAPPADPALEQPIYKQAFDLLMQRRYDEAKQAFRAFLWQYPNGRLAANAQYWVGEASYVMRDFATALDEFTKVVQNYPASKKVPDSLLKIAFIQYEQKEWVKARKTLESVVNQYATTTAARLARKRLERMRIEGN